MALIDTAILDGLTTSHDRSINEEVNGLFDDDLDIIPPELEPEPEATRDGNNTQLRGGTTMASFTDIAAIDDSVIYDSY